MEPELRGYFYYQMIEAVLKEMCQSPLRLLPNYRHWLDGGRLDLPELVRVHMLERDFVKTHARPLAMLLGSNVTNTRWAVFVLVGMAVYEVIGKIAA